jgi:hypothetical protein
MKLIGSILLQFLVFLIVIALLRSDYILPTIGIIILLLFTLLAEVFSIVLYIDWEVERQREKFEHKL